MFGSCGIISGKIRVLGRGRCAGEQGDRVADTKIEFLATVAPVSSALKFGGDAGRVTFEVPKHEIEKAVALIALQDVVLKVTVEVYERPKEEAGAKKEDGRSAERAVPQNFRF